MSDTHNQIEKSGSASGNEMIVATDDADSYERETPRCMQLFPCLDDFSIPRNIQPDQTWTESMREMSDHIGPYATLRIVAEFGGTDVYVGKTAARSPFRNIVDAEACERLARIYGRERVLIPVAASAVKRAKRAGLISAVRAGSLSLDKAAKIIGTSRTYVSHLKNHTDEGVGVEPSEIPLPREAALVLCFAAGVTEMLTALCAKSSEDLNAALQSHSVLSTMSMEAAHG